MSASAWLSLRMEQTQAQTPFASRLQPSGDRTLWSVTLGLRP